MEAGCPRLNQVQPGGIFRMQVKIPVFINRYGKSLRHGLTFEMTLKIRFQAEFEIAIRIYFINSTARQTFVCAQMARDASLYQHLMWFVLAKHRSEPCTLPLLSICD
jgi:hypothetical protein